MITSSQLNAVAKLLDTQDKNLVLSAVLKTLVENGIPMSEAYDAVFGEGAYRNLADSIRTAANLH